MSVSMPDTASLTIRSTRFSLEPASHPIPHPSTPRVTPKGGLFGGQAGYNYQAGNIVVGVEGDIQWSGEHDTAGCGLDCFANSGVVVATFR